MPRKTAARKEPAVPIRTPEQDAVFFDSLCAGQVVRIAANRADAMGPARYSYTLVHDWMRSDRQFALSVQGAMQEGTDALMAIGLEHATVGYPSKTKYVVKDGRPTGEVETERKIAHQLFIPVMRARERQLQGKESVFSNVVEHTGEDGGAIRTENKTTAELSLDAVSDDKLAIIIAAMLGGASPDDVAQTMAAMAQTGDGDA